jgi:hypothetical protein
LAVVESGQRWGAIDRQGREVIPPRFGFLGNFADNGLAAASTGGGVGDKNSRYGYIDRTGRFVIPETFLWAGSFAPTASDGGLEAPDGLARIAFTERETGYVDATGKVVTRFPAGVNAWGVSPNGLVRVQDTSTAKYGFADRTGKIVIPARFEQVGGFGAHGLAMAQENGKAGYIRADGSWAIAPRFSTAGTFDAAGQAQVAENGKDGLIDANGHIVATLPHETLFWWQQSDYAPFRMYPAQIDYPVERFGGWTLERTLYAVPEIPSMLPSPIGRIRLTFRTKDGLVRWRISTEGWVIWLETEEGDEKDADVSSSTRAASLAEGTDAVLQILSRQLEGKAEMSIAITSPGDAVQAAQKARLQRIAVNRAAYVAELDASATDLTRAIEAMNRRIREQFGGLSGMPCMPPQCLY